MSFSNPHGDLTNSDLEQAGVLGQADVANEQFDLRELTLATLCDNIAAVSRNRKGSLTSTGPPANMCRSSSLHRRHYRYYHEVSHISGDSNSMADDASRLWHLTDDQLLTHFNTHYPQSEPWQMCQLNCEMHSQLISMLEPEALCDHPAKIVLVLEMLNPTS